MSAAYLIPIILCLTGLAIRTGYELLKQAGRVNPKSKPVFAVVFVGMCMMLLSWPFLGYFDPIRLTTIPYVFRWTGLLLLILGLGLALGGLFQLRGLENIDHLVTNGLFARLRHPMYTGFILWIIGWMIFTGVIASLSVGLIGIACILFWRRLEEQNLETQFGEGYQRYKKQTWL
jgi:protein-S-isoprenylcysteine O-methyltransferase Ste14